MDEPKPEMPRVVIAIVSWNTRDLLLRCLDSLADEARRGQAEVHVVDNCSTDGSAEAARSAAPWANVIDADENLGFGRAVNLVAERTRSEWLLAANADIALAPGALRTLLDAGSDEPVGCVAPRLILPDGSTQHSVHPFPTVPFSAAFNFGLLRLRSRWAERFCLEGSWDPEKARDVPWAIGACLLLRRRAFDDVGGFDPAQWMYAEDLDLAWRLQAAGWRTVYRPNAHVEHEASPATDAAFGTAKTARFMAATYAVLLRRRGLARTWSVAGLHVLGAALRLAWMTPLGIVSKRWRYRATITRRWLNAHRQGMRSRSRIGAAS